MTSFVRTGIVTLFFCGVAFLAYWQLMLDHQAKTIKELQTLNEQMQQNLAEREAMIDRLSRNRRIAHVQVTDQMQGEAGAITQTSLQFIELDDKGAELARQTFTIPGNVLFVDAWTVKFDPEHVAEGHPLMGKTLVLLRRIYSDRLEPRAGFPIDTPGAIPPGYAATDAGKFEKRIWENFWKIATDADMARQLNVRVAQGEAVYLPVQAGHTYELIVDASGGMSLMPLPVDDSALTKVPG